ncbi:hypothetical protein D3C87_1520180 [compost metagenome]
MGFIDDQDAAKAMRNFSEVFQRAKTAVSAVDRIDSNDAWTVLLYLSLRMIGIVVRKHDCMCMGGVRTLPERHMCMDIQIHRYVPAGDGLQQSHIRRPS